MTSENQVTRTLLTSQTKPGTLIVSRGSDESEEASILSSGLGQIKAFNLSDRSSSQPYSFDTAGSLLGWGLFNAVGIGEHPKTGGIFSVDNGADDVTRDGVDVHQSNPGDELNYHGIVNDTSSTSNYGYPYCYATWNTSIPEAPAHLKVGEQFSAVDNRTLNDTTCRNEYVPPRLTFPPHQVKKSGPTPLLLKARDVDSSVPKAPVDILFADASTAYISFHGSSGFNLAPSPSPGEFKSSS